MKSEIPAIIAVGLIVFASILDSLVKPLSLHLATPYHYFTLATVSLYPFTALSILLKTVALILTPIILLSMIGLKRSLSGGIMLGLSCLLQLYALQDVSSKSFSVPLEWSLALALAGIGLIIPTVIFLFFGLFEKQPTPNPPL